MSTRRAALGQALAAVPLVVWFALPLAPIVLWAVAAQWAWPAVLPQRWGLTGWREAGAAGLPSAMARSTLLGLAVACLATPLGAMAGRALGWRLTRHSGAASLVLLAPIAIPPFAVATGLDTLVLRARLPGSLAVVLVLSVFALPYTTYILRAAHTATDPDLELQARMLGAAPRYVLRSITIPVLRPALVTAAAMAFLVGWSDYVVTLVLGGGRLVTAPMLLASSASGTGNEPLVAAISVASILPLLAVVAGGVLVRRGRRAGRREVPA